MSPPKYIVADSGAIEWRALPGIRGVEVKSLGGANGQTMELARYAPNTSYPEHVHAGPEFVFLLEGTARLAGRWLEPGWSSIGETGTIDSDFLSGASGCVFLAVNTDIAE
jgi:anti-sigma factor ChrR (cupin superfamily)